MNNKGFALIGIIMALLIIAMLATASYTSLFSLDDETGDFREDDELLNELDEIMDFNGYEDVKNDSDSDSNENSNEEAPVIRNDISRAQDIMNAQSENVDEANSLLEKLDEAL